MTASNQEGAITITNPGVQEVVQKIEPTLENQRSNCPELSHEEVNLQALEAMLQNSSSDTSEGREAWRTMVEESIQTLRAQLRAKDAAKSHLGASGDTQSFRDIHTSGKLPHFLVMLTF
jgi:hypothetical protein